MELPGVHRLLTILLISAVRGIAHLRGRSHHVSPKSTHRCVSNRKTINLDSKTCLRIWACVMDVHFLGNSSLVVELREYTYQGHYSAVTFSAGSTRPTFDHIVRLCGAHDSPASTGAHLTLADRNENTVRRFRARISHSLR